MSFILLGILNSQVTGAAPAGGPAFDHLQTLTVTGSSADVQFENVDEYASDYKHLQIRFETRSSRTGNQADALLLRLGTGDVVDTGSNYSYHYLRAQSSGRTSTGVSSTSSITLNLNAAAVDYTANAWTVGVLDIYDAFNSNKYPTVKCFTGQTFNEASLYLSSGSWRNTGTITDILFTNIVASPAVGSRYSIYGMRG